MVLISRIIIIFFLLCVSIYTMSFGGWTWKKKNKAGAIMVFLLAAAAVILPLYTMFFKE